MTDDLVLEPPATLVLEPHHRRRLEALERVKDYVRNPHAENTKRAYSQAARRWYAYADEQGLPYTPIEPLELTSYLQQMTEGGAAPNTVRLHLSALCSLDQVSRASPDNPIPQSIRETLIVQRWEEKWARSNPKRPRRKAAPFEPSALERVLRVVAERPKNAAAAAHALQAARDRCLLLFGVLGAFRASDLGELELEHVEPKERGLQVLLPRSKTDQAGEGRFRALMPQGRRLLCAVDAFHVWRRARGSAPGALFPAITRAGVLELGRALSERQITRLVTGYGERAGLELRHSSHSMRRTFYVETIRRGKPLNRIMQHADCRSADVAIGYMETLQLFDDNPTSGLLE